MSSLGFKDGKTTKKGLTLFRSVKPLVKQWLFGSVRYSGCLFPRDADTYDTRSSSTYYNLIPLILSSMHCFPRFHVLHLLRKIQRIQKGPMTILSTSPQSCSEIPRPRSHPPSCWSCSPRPDGSGAIWGSRKHVPMMCQ